MMKNSTKISRTLTLSAHSEAKFGGFDIRIETLNTSDEFNTYLKILIIKEKLTSFAALTCSFTL